MTGQKVSDFVVVVLLIRILDFGPVVRLSIRGNPRTEIILEL